MSHDNGRHNGNVRMLLEYLDFHVPETFLGNVENRYLREHLSDLAEKPPGGFQEIRCNKG